MKRFLSLCWPIALAALLFGCNDDDTDPPVAAAGADLAAVVGDSVALDGTASTDPDGGSLTYRWALTVRPDGSSAAVLLPNQPLAVFVPDVAGSYTVRLVVTNAAGLTAADELTVDADADGITAAVRIESNIDVPTTWGKVATTEQADYFVTRFINVNAPLTIAPGVRVVFARNAALQVTESGTLRALGTAADTIALEGARSEPGFWRGVFVASAEANALAHVAVRHGGSEGFDNTGETANVLVAGTGRLEITDCALTDGAGPGLRVRDGTTLAGFARNRLTRNAAPLVVSPTYYRLLDGATAYAGNLTDRVLSYGGEITLGDAFWPALDVPYELPSGVLRAAGALTLAPGVRLLVAPNALLRVVSGGALFAVGTAAAPIAIEGLNPTPGSWEGVQLFTDDSCRFEHVAVRHGGTGVNGANLTVNGAAPVTLRNCTLADGGGAGLRLATDTSRLAAFADNRLTGNTWPVIAAVVHYPSFDVGSDYAGNTNDWVRTYAASPVTDATTWAALNVPYLLAPAVSMVAGDVTVAPGARFLAPGGAGLMVTPEGSLRAVGAPGSEISFIGQADTAGHWRGLRFTSDRDENVLDYVEVANGGSFGFTAANDTANVQVSNGGRLMVTNSVIRRSGGWGLYVQGNGQLTQSGNLFSENESGDVGP